MCAYVLGVLHSFFWVCRVWIPPEIDPVTVEYLHNFVTSGLEVSVVSHFLVVGFSLTAVEDRSNDVSAKLRSTSSLIHCILQKSLVSGLKIVHCPVEIFFQKLSACKINTSVEYGYGSSGAGLQTRKFYDTHKSRWWWEVNWESDLRYTKPQSNFKRKSGDESVLSFEMYLKALTVENISEMRTIEVTLPS